MLYSYYSATKNFELLVGLAGDRHPNLPRVHPFSAVAHKNPQLYQLYTVP